MRAEIVQSLAKWKRMQLGELGFGPGYGLYTDMNALRPDETLDNMHSIYVDQWDWERVITPAERNVEFLRKIVRKIYTILKRTEHFVCERYPAIRPALPEEITFVHAEELRPGIPGCTPKQREHRLLKECGAAFIIGIGGDLRRRHDPRRPRAGLRRLVHAHARRTHGAQRRHLRLESGAARWRSSCPRWASAWTRRRCGDS